MDAPLGNNHGHNHYQWAHPEGTVMATINLSVYLLMGRAILMGRTIAMVIIGVIEAILGAEKQAGQGKYNG